MKIQVKLELEDRKKNHFILTEKQPTKQHPRSDRGEHTPSRERLGMIEGHPTKLQTEILLGVNGGTIKYLQRLKNIKTQTFPSQSRQTRMSCNCGHLHMFNCTKTQDSEKHLNSSLSKASTAQT